MYKRKKGYYLPVESPAEAFEILRKPEGIAEDVITAAEAVVAEYEAEKAVERAAFEALGLTPEGKCPPGFRAVPDREFRPVRELSHAYLDERGVVWGYFPDHYEGNLGADCRILRVERIPEPAPTAPKKKRDKYGNPVGTEYDPWGNPVE